ncbi:MAG: DUF192 domain-containing protein [Candidatus Paceibacterota bacterium]
MKLINETKDKVITKSIRKLKTLKEKSIGLIGAIKPESVYFKTRLGIHTSGMKFSIDVVVADKNLVVKKIKKVLEPGNFFVWNILYNNIFELPKGLVDKSNTEVGDKLKLI